MNNCTSRMVSGHGRQRISATSDTTNVDLFSMSQIPNTSRGTFGTSFILFFYCIFSVAWDGIAFSILGMMARRSDMAKQNWSTKSFAKQFDSRAQKL